MELEDLVEVAPDVEDPCPPRHPADAPSVHGRPLGAQENVVRTTITALAKTEDDRKMLLGQDGKSGFVSEWLKGG